MDDDNGFDDNEEINETIENENNITMKDKGKKLEAQYCIELSLNEIKEGNYDQAIILLRHAKMLWPESQAGEMLDLVLKLQRRNRSPTPTPAGDTHSNASYEYYNNNKNSNNNNNDNNSENNNYNSSNYHKATNDLHRRKCSSTPINDEGNESTTAAAAAAADDFTPQQLELVEQIKNCQNFYEVLNVSHVANDAEIKKAYKRLALQLHPDKNRAPGAIEAFKLIATAVEVLSNANKRKEYDESGANTLTRGGWLSSNEYNYSEQRNYHHHPQYYEEGQATYETPFDNEEITVEELFQMFFGNFPSMQGQQRQRRTYQYANQRQPQETFQQPSMVFTFVLVIIVIWLLSSLFTSDPAYNLSQTNKYPVRRETQHLRVPYFVKENFERDFRGSLGRLENDVEEDYVRTMKHNCFRERNYHEMDELIEKLKATTVSAGGSNADANCHSATTSLLTEISATKDPKLFDKHELADFFLTLIQSEDTNVRKEAAKCVAEITKSEAQRKKFTKPAIIKLFIACLRNIVPDKGDNMELPIQICRALGNICYLNDEARDIILELKGDEVLVQLLDLTSISDKENELQFIKVRGGVLSNYLLGGEGLVKRAMDLQIMEKLQNLIKIAVDNVDAHEDLLLNTLPLLSILTENVTDLNFDSSLNITLSRILAASTNPDLAEMCLELLHYQAENDDVKLLLAKDGLCETIYNLLEKYKTLASTCEARALMKLACELIVLILTGDDSMHFLYGTTLLKNMEDWLDSQDIDLLTTGVLALGNFARTDSHCIYMVEHKIMNKLLDVLAKNNGVKDDVRLQHALLSALRNLVIPKPNKSAVIQAGLVETILPMLEIHQPPVVFKLLGTLRMTVDGQETLALKLLKNKTLIEQLVHWSKSSDYAGVTGESLRLMAWLIKHAYLNKIAYALPRKGDAPADQLADKLPIAQNYDNNSLKEFIANEGAVEAMINMLTSQHLVMQNEALIALCIFSVVFLINAPNSEDTLNLQSAFIKFEVGKKLAELIEKSSDTMTKEIVENLQNFTNLLKTSDKLAKHLEEHNINELLKNTPILTEYCTL